MELKFDAAHLAAAFGLSVEDFTANFTTKEEGKDPVLLPAEELPTKLKALYDTEKARFVTEGMGIGKRTRMAEFEENLRTKYGKDKKQQGESLVDAIVAAKEAEIAEWKAKVESFKGQKIDDMPEEKKIEFVVNHPKFAEKMKEFEAKLTEKESEFTAYKTQIERRAIIEAVQAKAKSVLDEFAPKLPEDPKIAQNQISLFIKAVENSAGFKIENNEIIPLDADGNPLKDENYRHLNFAEFVKKEAAKYFVPHPVDPKKQAPPANGGGAGAEIPDWSKMTQEQIYETVTGADPAKQQVLLDSAKAYLQK
jgi:hypothetical protein